MATVQQREIDELLESGFGELDSLDSSAKFDGVAYHYTDASAAKSIIENQEIWLTDVQHMSDKSELKYPLGCIDEVLTNFREAHSEEPLNTILEALQETLLEVFSDFRAFAACFSKSSDKLSQWRAYADDGSGYAIGVRLVQDWSAHTESITKDASIVSIRYGKTKLMELQNQYLEQARVTTQMVRDAGLLEGDGNLKHFVQRFTSRLTGLVMSNALFHKHEGFAEEDEARILLLLDRKRVQPFVKLRESCGRLVPYVPYKIGKNSIEICELVLGPAAHEDENNSASDLLLAAKMERGKVPVVRSEIPYRAWRGG